jgi:hypothetical protein
VTLDFTTEPIEVEIECVEVTAEAFAEDPELVEEMKKFSCKMDDELVK